MKKEKIITFLTVILLGWYGIHAIAGLVLGIELHSKFFLGFALLLMSALFFLYGSRKLFEKEILPVLVIYLFYVYMFLTNARHFPSIAAQLGLLDPSNFIAQLLEGLSLAIIFKRKIVDTDRLLYRLYLSMTGLSVILFVVMLVKFGPGFIFREAFMFGSGVSLITFSYYSVINCVLGFYLLTKTKQKNKQDQIKRIVTWGFFIFSLLIILVMGKRGAILSLVIPVLAYFFFRKFSVKRSLLYLGLVSIFYFILVSNIDSFFDFIALFSNRLAEQCRLAYYMGDSNGRDVIWETAIEQFNRNPLFGYFPRLIDVGKYAFYYGMHPHNYWLESLMTMGLVGSIPFFGYLVYLLLFKFYRALKTDSPYRFWALLLVSEIIHGTFSSPLNSSIIWVTILVLSHYLPQKDKFLLKTIDK